MRATIAGAVFLAAIFAAGQAVAECRCRYDGSAIELGQTICMATPNGLRQARCDMVINNPSWTFLDKPCPTAGLQSQRSTKQAAKPVPPQPL